MLDDYSTGKRLRACEWALIAFFLYIAGISLAFHSRSPRGSPPLIIAALAGCLLLGLAYAEEYGSRRFFTFARDWVTLALVLVAYREMDWFTPRFSDRHLENAWIVWDRLLLHRWGLQKAIEAGGPPIPNLLELSYLLVYAVGPLTVAILYLSHRRDRIGWVLSLYVTGTVAAYGLFPYFPSSPPRTLFPDADLPTVMTLLRRVNLFLCGDYGIHSSVFPSAHVSSAFSAAWALRIFVADKPYLGWMMAVYAVLVSVATIYGRYHFAVDVLAGFGVSVGAALLIGGLWAKLWFSSRWRSSADFQSGQHFQR